MRLRLGVAVSAAGFRAADDGAARGGKGLQVAVAEAIFVLVKDESKEHNMTANARAMEARTIVQIAPVLAACNALPWQVHLPYNEHIIPEELPNTLNAYLNPNERAITGSNTMTFEQWPVDKM